MLEYVHSVSEPTTVLLGGGTLASLNLGSNVAVPVPSKRYGAAAVAVLPAVNWTPAVVGTVNWNEKAATSKLCPPASSVLVSSTSNVPAPPVGPVRSSIDMTRPAWTGAWASSRVIVAKASSMRVRIMGEDLFVKG